MPNTRLVIEIDEHSRKVLLVLVLIRVNVHVLVQNSVKPPDDLQLVELISSENCAINWDQCGVNGLKMLAESVCEPWIYPSRSEVPHVPLHVAMVLRVDENTELLEVGISISIQGRPKIVINVRL
jgi:hypothetical protein